MPVLAQALIEKGALDSIAAGFGLLRDTAVTLVTSRRGLVALAILAVLVILWRRKS